MATDDLVRQLKDEANGLLAEADKLRQKAQSLQDEARIAEKEAEEVLTAVKVLERKAGIQPGHTAQEDVFGNTVTSEKPTLLEAAMTVLSRSGTPMTATEIADELLRTGFSHPDRKVLRQSLNGVLGREFRSGSGLTRPRKGYYSLATSRRGEEGT